MLLSPVRLLCGDDEKLAQLFVSRITTFIVIFDLSSSRALRWLLLRMLNGELFVQQLFFLSFKIGV